MAFYSISWIPITQKIYSKSINNEHGIAETAFRQFDNLKILLILDSFQLLLKLVDMKN